MNNYYNPYTSYYPSQQSSALQQPRTNEFAWVQGEAGAKAFIVPPGMTCWLMDSESPTFYMKTTDVNGMPQPLRIFDFKERTESIKQEQPYVTREEMKAYIDELLKKGEVNESIAQPATVQPNSTK
jgi:hypothetical protein